MEPIQIVEAISAVGSCAAAFLSWQSAQTSLKMSRRSSMLVLFEMMKPLQEIQNHTAENDIRLSISTFEYISHLIDADVVEEQLIELVWGDFIARSVTSMKAMTTVMPMSGQSPSQLIGLHPKVEELATKLKANEAKRLTYKK